MPPSLTWNSLAQKKNAALVNPYMFKLIIYSTVTVWEGRKLASALLRFAIASCLQEILTWTMRAAVYKPAGNTTEYDIIKTRFAIQQGTCWAVKVKWLAAISPAGFSPPFFKYGEPCGSLWGLLTHQQALTLSNAAWPGTQCFKIPTSRNFFS